MLIGIVYDLRSEYLAIGVPIEQVAEFDSADTIAAIEQELRSLGHDTERIGHAKALCARLAGGGHWDLVFNIAEGLHGRAREAQAPCLLDVYEIPYTFSDPLVCALTLDKAITKSIVRGAGVNTPDFWVVREALDIKKIPRKFPLFAKPLAEGTGKGIDERSKITDAKALESVCKNLLQKFAQPVLVEVYLPGREFTVGVLGASKNAYVPGLMEVTIRPGANVTTYSLHAKEECDDLIDYCHVPPGALRNDLEQIALDAFRCLDCRDAARVDIRLDAADRPAFIEINPLPGLHPTHSDLPILCAMNGMPYSKLIASIVESAQTRVRQKT